MHIFNLKLSPLLFSIVAFFATHASFAQANPDRTPSNSETPSVIVLTENDGDMQNLGCITTEMPLPGREHQIPLGSTFKIALSGPQVHERAYRDAPAYDFTTTWCFDNDYIFSPLFPSSNSYSLWSYLLSHDPSTDSEDVPRYHNSDYTTVFLFTFSAFREGYTLLHFRRHQTIYGYDGEIYFNIHVVPAAPAAPVTSQTSETAP